MYAIVFLPNPPIDQIEYFRKKYDPKCDFIPAHITLIFPFKFTDETVLIQHIEEKVATLKPFNIITTEHKKSHDNYLFLVFEEGNTELTSLHDALYTGVLNEFLRSDLNYEPHMTIGYFQNNEGGFQEDRHSNAVRELEKNPINWGASVDNVTLVKFNESVTDLRIVKTFHFLAK